MQNIGGRSAFGFRIVVVKTNILENRIDQTGLGHFDPSGVICADSLRDVNSEKIFDFSFIFKDKILGKICDDCFDYRRVVSKHATIIRIQNDYTVMANVQARIHGRLREASTCQTGGEVQIQVPTRLLTTVQVSAKPNHVRGVTVRWIFFDADKLSCSRVKFPTLWDLDEDRVIQRCLRECLNVVSLTTFQAKHGCENKYETDCTPVDNWRVGLPIVDTVLLLGTQIRLLYLERVPSGFRFRR